MANSDTVAQLIVRRNAYQAALTTALLQPDMQIDGKRTFRTEWLKTLEGAIESINEQLAKYRTPYQIRLAVESV